MSKIDGAEGYIGQLSFTSPEGAMTNLRGTSTEEFTDTLDWFIKGGGEVIAEAITHAKAINLVREQLGGRYVDDNGGSRGSGYSGRPAPGGNPRSGNGTGGGGSSAPGGPPANHNLATECRHGEKNYVSGVSAKNGKPWFGFDCPQNYKQGECARFAQSG